ncbi:MAG: ArsR family transcriptional regulator [Spirochaetaceae bacterium]|nr:MAG: ArsR family transcriptional regulator [Spirochaetaceae bacterium]
MYNMRPKAYLSSAPSGTKRFTLDNMRPSAYIACMTAHTNIPEGEAETLQNTAATLFRTLADETRLRILHLFFAQDRPLCVCELVDAMGLPQYQVSRHLSALKQAGLVTAQKRGTWAYHRLESTMYMKNLVTLLEEILVGEPYAADLQRLEMRLQLRANEQCVVGFVSNDELQQLIKRVSPSAPAQT